MQTDDALEILSLSGHWLAPRWAMIVEANRPATKAGVRERLNTISSFIRN